MRKKSAKEENDNQDRWLLTYSDMITLLMAFFLMMYSMSVLNLSKFRDAAISIRSGFGGVVRGQGKSVLSTSGLLSAQPSAIDGNKAGAEWRVLKPLVDYIENDKKLKKMAQVKETSQGIVITILSDHLLFEPGHAEVRAEALPLLDHIAETLDKVGNNIRIEGHTCNLTPRSSKYPTNWELSTARAVNVLRYMVEQKGLDARQFSAAGYGSMKPSAPNTSEANRRKNRRVEIVIVSPANRPVEKTNQLREEIRRIPD